MAAEAVNPAARRAFAQLLRQFHSGKMTNFEYEDRVESIRRTWGRDDAVDAIHVAQWPAHCDLFEHRMTDAGQRLGRRERRWVARYVLFLRSESAATPAAVPATTVIQLIWTLAVVVGALTPSAAVLVGLATGHTALVACGLAVVAISWAFAFAIRAWGKVSQRSPGAMISDTDCWDFWPFATWAAFCEARCRPTYLYGKSLSNSARSIGSL